MPKFTQIIANCLLNWMRPTASTLADAIARIQAGDTTLTHLNLRNTGLTDKELKKLCHAIRTSGNTTLVSLDISCNLITDQGLAALSDLSSLNSLNGSSNHFGIPGIVHLCKNTGIKHLSLRQNNLDHAAATLLAQQPQYEEIDLGSNQIQDNGAVLFATHPNLRALDISANRITDVGMTAFGPNSKLTHLIMRFNQITDTGVDQCLSINTVLRYLDLGNNALVNPTSIGQQSSLNYLNLYANHIDDNGAATIARNARLRVVLLNANEIGDTGAQTLDDQKYPFLDLSGNKAIQNPSLQNKVWLTEPTYQKLRTQYPPLVLLPEEPTSPAPKMSNSYTQLPA